MTDQLDTVLWLSLAVFGLGVLFCVPIWVQNWSVRRGASQFISEGMIICQIAARCCLLFGSASLVGTGLTYASRVMSFGMFAVVGVAFIALMLAISFRIDAVRARNHR